MATKEQQLEAEIDRLRRLLNLHIGPKPAAMSTDVPHTQLSAFSRGAYTITNPNERRSFDTTTVTLDELAEIVGTILSDLQSIKVLG